MKTKLFAILAVVILFLAATAQAYPNWDIYSDTDIYSGTYGLINVYDTPPDNTTVNMYGGLADYIGTHDSSTLNMFDGHTELQAMDTSTINISGGEVSLALAWQYGEINISSNAQINGVDSRNFSVISIYGGNVELIGALDSGTVNLYGGDVTNKIYASDYSQINIYGHDLFKTDSGGTYGYGQLYGFLMDETYVCVDLANQEAYDHINLIPEPSTLTLFGINSLILLRRKGSKNK